MAGEGSNNGAGDGSMSPKNKVKFLCSYGGKILPRPTDGQLKYVGGETRVIAAPRETNFSELMKKVTTLVEGDMVLKYQLLPEDLDALVSVRTDEDLKHMYDEHDRHAGDGSRMLRAFLFPSKPVVLENQGTIFEPHELEQRYIDAINGIIRTSPKARHSPPMRDLSISSAGSSPKSSSPDAHTNGHISHDTSFKGSHNSFDTMHRVGTSPRARISPMRPLSSTSACSSPLSTSPDGHTNDNVIHDSCPFKGSHGRPNLMHRVRSSPSIVNINNLQSQSTGYGGHSMQQSDHSYHHNYQHRPLAHAHAHAHAPFRTPQDPHVVGGVGRFAPTLAMAKVDVNRGSGFNPCYSTSRYQKGNGGYSKIGYRDESTAYAHNMVDGSLDRAVSLPRKPRRNIWDF
ncbi:hypothetical protein L6164_036159 [Bauhinia variegata]|uniref:Uncharacterized protein n=1 Tax=Bauhinia variegata TaxID=167791 RepID=A0ACB9KGB8_BAUVA|nr:hypothetical protein L6164_036159 [Bauhinia variegata]